MGHSMSRREALAVLGSLAAGAVAGSGFIASPARAQSAPGGRRTRLILLGTDGGPRPKKSRAAPALVILADGVPYVVDCGEGVARQLVLANVPLRNLRTVFITHQHSDHNAGFASLLLLSWASGLGTPVDIYGPPPLVKMTQAALELNRYDIETRIEDEGRKPLAPLIRPHELTQGGVVMQDERIKVTCALVNHPPVVPAFAYRFDGADRSIVVSGDTTPADALVALASGADVLVHEVLHVPSVDRIVANIPNASRLKEHIIASHTSLDDVGKVAARAGVKTLVLTHLVPSEEPKISDEQWLEGARANFKGEIVVGRDLLEI
jgi:ribonuclease BN (tRNA processing enzyme)